MNTADENRPIPPRPWTVTETEEAIRVSSIETDESVLWIDLEGAHRPTELARANFIVNTINKVCTMSEPENLVDTLKRLGPEHVVDGKELCPQCDRLSPGLSIDEPIIHCSLCHDAHAVTVEEADRWREEMWKRHGKSDDGQS
jgi:hypothetical protein